jgi:steroid 5-alpha reductase family enzyme
VPSSLFLWNLAVIAGLMGAAWLVSLAKNDVSVVDVFWGLGFVAVAWCSWLGTAPATPRGLLVLTLVSTWGLRLAGYLAWRKYGQPEDDRYRALRERWGSGFWLTSLLLVFGLQGGLIWVISLPLQAAPGLAAPVGLGDAAGVVVWAIGLFFESVGDYQLARFKADPANRGQVFAGGLWRYTRHPNYFGDFLVWWGLGAIALAGGGPWWLVLSPALMSYLLLRVSGVRLLERSLVARKRGYDEYLRQTSAFFPWPPRREKE